MTLEDQGNIGQGGDTPAVMEPEDFLGGGQVEPTPGDQSSQEPAIVDEPEVEPQDSNPELEQLRADLEETQRNFKELQAEFTRRNQAPNGWQQPQQQNQPQPGQGNVLGLDLSKMEPADQQAISFLGQLVTNAIDQRLGPVTEQVNQFQADTQLQSQIQQMKIKDPTFDAEKALGVLRNEKISDLELAHGYLQAQSAPAQAAAKTKADLLRKSGANTASGKGKAPSTGKIRPYDSKTDANRPIDELVREGMTELGT